MGPNHGAPLPMHTNGSPLDVDVVEWDDLLCPHLAAAAEQRATDVPHTNVCIAAPPAPPPANGHAHNHQQQQQQQQQKHEHAAVPHKHFQAGCNNHDCNLPQAVSNGGQAPEYTNTVHEHELYVDPSSGQEIMKCTRTQLYRVKNTQAVKRYRERKKTELQASVAENKLLTEKNEQLTTENEALKLRCQELQAHVDSLNATLGANKLEMHAELGRLRVAFASISQVVDSVRSPEQHMTST